MIYFLFGAFLISTILCTQIPGVFDEQNVLTGYITPENNLLIFSRNNNGNMTLYKYETDSHSIAYKKNKKLELEPFPTNDSETITDFYFSFAHINSTCIEFTIFNEKYLSSYIYKGSSNYSFISMEEIGPNKLAIFHNSINASLNNNTISIASFDYKNKKLNFSKTYSIDIKRRANIYCISTNNNNIVCGIIEVYKENSVYCNYSLILLQEETEIEKKNLYSSSDSIGNVNGIFKNLFLKLIPLENEKIIYCSYSLLISCGLAKVINNSNLTILIRRQNILIKMAEPNNLRKNIFSAIQFSNNEVLLSFIRIDKRYYYRLLIKIIVLEDKNNTDSIYINDIQDYSYTIDRYNLHDYIQLLKNKDNNTIFIIIYDNKGEFYQLGYSSCINKEIFLYNGDKSLLQFNISPSLYKGYDNDIVFVNNKKEYNSLFYNNETQPLKTETIYNNMKNISFYLNLKDYDDIKKNGLYNIKFRNTLDPRESEECTLTLKFYKCDEECDICTSTECYDKYRNLIDLEELKTKKYVIRIAVIMLITIFALVILILLAFIRGLKRGHNANINNPNNEEDQIPLVIN